ncbi:hypothetical protein KY290_038280 [Solanum tuberosum]|uniref:Retrotransposon Copia-like N-terminal domain-containing protein n=1 Tax=Solanum tuberosum TaxID=4113 RepID=A0ABQ7TYN1_SOLTU|nr:hypothetical protein KY290_038280 [Solanum tuberosum]
MVVDPPTTSSDAVTMIDTGKPLYIHPSDNPSFTLAPTPFDGTGYRSWKRSVLRSLSVKNKLDFVTGEYPKPDTPSTTVRQWERCDDMVISWILNSLSKEIADSVEYVANSEELWKELQDRYDQTNGAKLYQIQKEINDLSQGALDITGYYTRIKKLWEELSTLAANHICNCRCTCGAKNIMYKAEHDRRLIQFLMGLNEVYTIMRGSILMMTPLPSMGQVFALLVQEEKQREIKPHNQMFAETASLAASASGTKNFKTSYTSNTNTNEASSRQGQISQNNSYNQRNYGYNPPTNNQRNTINGYNNRFNKGKGIVANAHSDMNPIKSEEPQYENHQGTQLSKEQYDQLMNMLQHFNNSDPRKKADLWILDSGASHHMTFNRQHLTNILQLPYPLLVKLPNGYNVKVTKVGNVAPSLKRPLEIGNVHDGLYLLCPNCLRKGTNISESESCFSNSVFPS